MVMTLRVLRRILEVVLGRKLVLVAWLRVRVHWWSMWLIILRGRRASIRLTEMRMSCLLFGLCVWMRCNRLWRWRYDCYFGVCS